MKLPAHRLRKQLRISVDDLRPGMFVAELDRPWAETPFTLQGFLLEQAEHLQTMRELAREVTIDPQRSDTSALTHLPWDVLHEAVQDIRGKTSSAIRNEFTYAADAARAEKPPPFAALRELFGRNANPAPVQQPAPYYLRYAAEEYADELDDMDDSGQPSDAARKSALASKLTPPSTPHFSQFIASLYPRDITLSGLGLIERVSLWWSRQPSVPGPKTPAKRPKKSRPDFLPEAMPLVVYRDQPMTVAEATRAQKVVRQADALLVKFVNDVQTDLPIKLDDLQPVVNALVQSVINNPTALMWSARMRDESEKTYLHGLKVAIYMLALGRHLGFPKEQLNELGNIGFLLDIGMLKLPADLLEKTEELTPEENALLIQHVAYGMQTLEQASPLPHNIALGIREHHERIDGSGYPQGLAGEAISIYGRMAAIADSFAAMTTARPYDVTHSAFDALKDLFKGAETNKLHAPLVEQFVQAISIFPVGSLIELSSGEVAIVLEHNKVRRLEPQILVLTDAGKEMLPHPFVVDLIARNKSNSERTKILRGLPDGAYDINYRDYYLN